mgnify:CR=1 FL=1
MDPMEMARKQLGQGFERLAASFVEQAHETIATSFNDVGDVDARDFIKLWLATDPMIRRTEEAVAEQFRIGSASQDNAVRDRSLKNIETGMRYWQELIDRKMKGATRR